MKKILAFFVMLSLTFFVIGCKALEEEETGFNYDAISDTMESTNGKYQIAFITDIGQLKDKSFNQGT